MEFLTDLASALRESDPLVLFVVFAIAVLVMIERLVVRALDAVSKKSRGRK